MAKSSFDLIAPPGEAFAVTPSDSTVFAEFTRGIYVGTAGNLVCDMYDPTTKKLTQQTFYNLNAGMEHAIRTNRIYAATTASQIVALL